MNKAKMIELLESGAFYNWIEGKFYHPSFRKGFRKVASNNISWEAVKRVHGLFGTNRLVEENNIYRLT
jgi:hypothetical protein